MGYWLVFGLLLAGCGVGALLTAAVYLTQLKRVKSDLQTGYASSTSTSQVPPDSNEGPQRKSA